MNKENDWLKQKICVLKMTICMCSASLTAFAVLVQDGRLTYATFGGNQLKTTSVFDGSSVNLEILPVSGERFLRRISLIDFKDLRIPPKQWFN